MQWLLDMLGRKIHRAALTIELDDGARYVLGDGAQQAGIRARDASVLRRVALDPKMRFGEAYVAGLWEPADCALIDVLRVATLIQQDLEPGRVGREITKLQGNLRQWDYGQLSRRNVSHHYDRPPAFYASFLDADLHYSCAYFSEPDMSLEAAQQAKCAHIARKLDLEPGAEVLDIGCGFGSMALFLAEQYNARVTGITLSQAQLAVARERARERGLDQRVQFEWLDYRTLDRDFDAIVSIGMFEHVGRPQFRTYFDQVRRCLKPHGTALIHSIGRFSPPGRTNPWIAKYIFPGGYIPALSETAEALEPHGLLSNDIEIWRLHYAKTLAAWRERFAAVRPQWVETYDEAFCRMWEFYLCGSQASFEAGDMMVFHLQLTHDLERLPLTRNYLYAPDEAASKASSA